MPAEEKQTPPDEVVVDEMQPVTLEKPASASDVKTPAEPVFVSQTDRLIAENINLKLIAAVSRETLAQMQLNEATAERVRRFQDLNMVKGQLEAKYHFSLATHIINEGDGQILPRTPAQGGTQP